MRNRFTVLTIALASAAAAALLTLAASRAIAQAPSTYRAPRAPDGKPDLNGIWQALNEANWDIEAHGTGPSPYPELLGALFAHPASQGVVEGGTLPYRPEALARKKQNFEQRLTRPTTRELNETTGDPEAKCYMPGVPRATYMPYPFQIVQTPQQVLIAYEFANAVREIHIGRKPEAPAESWMGWSIGRWEGDTLVVDVTDQVERTWFDRAGNFHSDALHVVERYTPTSPDHLMYEATIEDPKVFTRPWKMSMPLYRRVEKNALFIDFKCVEYAQEFMYGHLISEVLK
jgi:hypothetical protein